jgi:OFA family oxalate/formate antiporter-like MFS transporter
VTSESLGRSEFRRGWRPLLAASIAVSFSSTILPFNTLGALVAPLESEFGWQRADIQFSYFLFTMLSGLSYPAVGSLIDRFGARRVALVGMPAFSLAFAAIGLSGPSLPVFYALWMATGLLGAAATPVTFTRVVNEWFVARRGLALSLTLLVAGFVSSVLQVGSTLLVQSMGWRAALFTLAVVPLVLALPFMLAYFRSPPVEMSGTVTASGSGSVGVALRTALHGYRFYALAAGIVCVTLGISGTMINFKPLMTDAGITPETAAYIAGAVGLSVMVGRLGVGLLIDRFWAPGLAFPLLALPAVSCVLLASAPPTPNAALVAGILIGLAAGAEADVLPYLTARYFGLRHYGRIFGTLYAVFIISSGIAPYLFGLVYDQVGTYAPALYTSALLFVVGAGSLLSLGAYPQLLPDASDMERKAAS